MPSSSLPVSLPASANLEHLKKQAKDLRDALRVGDPAALARRQAVVPQRSQPSFASAPVVVSLSQAQFVLAREYGFASWPRLKRHVEALAATRQTPSAQSPTDAADAADAASTWDALLRADPAFARLTDAERQAIPPIHIAQWRETSTRWDEPHDEEYSRQAQQWARFQPPAHAWHINDDDDEGWSHDVIDARGHFHTASSWDTCHLRPFAHPLTAEDLLGKVLFWSPENEPNIEGSGLQRLRDTWQRERTTVDGRPLIRWHRQTIENNFRVNQSVWTEPGTCRITRTERHEINLAMGRNACFVVSDQYVYDVEPPARTFEMPPDKPIVLSNEDDTAPQAWDTFLAKQKQAVRDVINRSDAGWRRADFALFGGVWSFGMTNHLPLQAEWKERVRKQAGMWREWNSQVETADTQTYLPVRVTTDTAALMAVKDEVLGVKVKLRVTWDETGGAWEGDAEFFLRRKGRGYEIAHWECPWAEIEAARVEGQG